MSMFDYPKEPELPENDGGEETLSLRYDDVMQDGRLRLDAVWRPVGRLIWSRPEPSRVLAKLEEGIGTVLARAVFEATEVRVPPRAPVRTRAWFRFEHTLGNDGKVDRIQFNTWIRSTVQGDDSSEPLLARAYGQRVFTRIGASPGSRSVTRLEGLGADGVPHHRNEWLPARTLLDIPKGAVLLDMAPRLDPGRIVFGLSHTDGNHHVNFLVYPRFIEEAALGRFFDLGVGAKLAARWFEIRYRKPSFAGDCLRVVLQAFRAESGIGVVAAAVEDDGGPPERPWTEFPPPRAIARVLFKS
jgi:hypothetical protein